MPAVLLRRGDIRRVRRKQEQFRGVEVVIGGITSPQWGTRLGPPPWLNLDSERARGSRDRVRRFTRGFVRTSATFGAGARRDSRGRCWPDNHDPGAALEPDRGRDGSLDQGAREAAAARERREYTFRARRVEI